MENVLLSTKQVAERLRISPMRVRALISAGRLPSQQIGRDHLIKESDLALVSERKAGRPKKELGVEIAPGVKKLKAEQVALPAVASTTKRAATKPTPSKAKTVATKQGGKR